MKNDELVQHLELLDGIQKAQMVVLRALLRQEPAIKQLIWDYAEQLDTTHPAEGMTEVQLGAMKDHLLGLTK